MAARGWAGRLAACSAERSPTGPWGSKSSLMIASAVASAPAWSAKSCIGENNEQAPNGPTPGSSFAISSNLPAGSSMHCVLPTATGRSLELASGISTRFMHQGVSSTPIQSPRQQRPPTTATRSPGCRIGKPSMRSRWIRSKASASLRSRSTIELDCMRFMAGSLSTSREHRRSALRVQPRSRTPAQPSLSMPL